MSRADTHLHYADFNDSHWFKGSVTDGGGIWVRDPIIDGDETNPIDNALELLDQARKEVQAVENMLGINVAGTRTNLVQRLEKRVSPSGLRRGAVSHLRGPNSVVGTPTTISNWWDHGTIYWQLFRVPVSAGVSTVNATFPKAYFVGSAPDLIVVTNSNNDQNLGSVQVRFNFTTTTQCSFHTRAHDGAGGWGAPAAQTWYHVCAIGGFPST